MRQGRLGEVAEHAKQLGVPASDLVQLILTDIEMPGMDGYVLTRKVKDDPRFANIPIVMHSSLSADANVTIGKSVGVDAYVPKFDARDLAKALEPYLKVDKPNG